jgi:hypothetical protein
MPPDGILFVMSLLIRIILQRLALIVFSFLTFLGINPDVSVPSPDVIQATQDKQDQLVEDVLQPNGDSPIDETRDIEKKITDLQDGFTETVIDPITDTLVQGAVPTDVVSDDARTDFNVKDVVVNILCLEKTSTYTKMSSGSGVIISSNGLVLTNAHVAYPFLQSSQFGMNTYSCTVRRENIPNYGYNAELVYYPLDWLNENSEVIKDPSPVGTGENDYAILLLTTPIGPAPKTATFSSASLSVGAVDLKNDLSVTIAGYPSSNSGVFAVDARPGLKVADTHIDEFFTFATRTFDVLQTGANSVAKRGSSGGGVFNNGALYGLIVTTNQSEDGAYANALTLPYIKRDFESDTGIDLDDFVTTSLDVLKLRFSVSYKDELKRIISESLGL